MRSMTAPERRIFVFLLAALMVEMVFFIVLGPLLGHYSSTFHLTRLEAGLLSASYSIGCGIAAIPASRLADRFGAQLITVCGLTLVGLACAGFALAPSAFALDAARTVQGFGAAALWAGAVAWLMALGGSENRGRVLGAAFSAAGVGACIGPALGGLASIVGTEPMFLSLAGVILAMAAIGASIRGAPASAKVLAPRLRDSLACRPVRQGLYLVALPSIAFGVVGVLVPLRLHGLGVATTAVAAAYVLAALLEAIINPFVGAASDRDEARTMRLAIAAAVTYLLLLALGLPPALLLAAVVFGWPVLGSAWVPALARLSGAMEREGHAVVHALGLFNLCWAVFQAVGAVGGAKLAGGSSWLPYVALAVVYVVVARVAGLVGAAARRVPA